MNKTFLTEEDSANLETKMDEIKNNVDQFNSIVKNTANKYTEHLDRMMQKLYKMFMSKQNDTPTQEIENCLPELTSLLYFMADKVEQLNIYSDMAKKSLSEAYNNVYLDSSRQKDERGKAVNTVAENTAIAENATIEDAVMASVYASAYRIVKSKIDAGYAMVDTLKKVLSSRMQEQQTVGKNRTLLEG